MVAVDQAKKRAKDAAMGAEDAAQEAGKKLGDFLFGEEEAPAPSDPKSRDAVEASKKWEDAKTRISARDRDEKNAAAARERAEKTAEARERLEREVDRDLEALKRKLGK